MKATGSKIIAGLKKHDCNFYNRIDNQNYPFTER
jgi:hypothetical protein